MTLASLTVGPIQFDTPIWLWLIPIGWALIVWFGRSSLSGLGTTTRRIAMVVRLIVIAILAGAMAEPQWRNQSKAVDVTFVVDASRSIPQHWQKDIDRYVEDARKADKRLEDQMGVITVAQDAYVQALPSKLNVKVEKQYIGPEEATNLEGGIRLALAIRNAEEAAAKRIVLISDGNETEGSVLAAAEAALAVHVPIDVLPVTYQSEGEVILDELVAPTTARMGENVNLKIVLQSTKAARGRLNLTLNGDPIKLDPDAEGFGKIVDLKPGQNVFQVPVTVPKPGPQEWRAVFEAVPDARGQIGDAIAENNQQSAVTFVASEGRTLIIADNPEEAQPLVGALNEAKIATQVLSPDQAPKTLTEMNGFDAIILFNQPSYAFSQAEQEQLKQYVHDTGGGLVMIGGPSSFGAGGWIGSPLEDALPVKLDPPQKRQMPRGALVIITHSIEMPDGVSFGKKTAKAAVDALSRLDLIGLVEFDGNSVWRFPLNEVGDGSGIKRAIENLAFGDMPDYNAPMQLAYNGLVNVQAGIKHCILITDGDAQPPNPRLLQLFNKERITVSTVAVYPHWPADLRKLQAIADATHGRHYEVTTTGGLGNIVQIFIKEAQTVKRSLIWEGDPFSPAVSGLGVESMRGITSVPPITGYVVTAEREGLTQVTMRGKEGDPIDAQWQYGLGRVIAFTSDATSRWDAAWISWPGYKQFWEQHVRWAMRPTGNANLRVTTEKQGDRTRIIVDATDANGERMNFARFGGRLAAPGGGGDDIELKQTGPGRYEGSVDTKQSGSYVASLVYAAPEVGPNGETKIVKGSVQAAVSRPFADEFRALSDNGPLLQQVARLTGGRVLNGQPEQDDLWTRDGVTMPVATTPVWMAFALAGIGLFLMDVAVRRVRIDVPAMARAVARGFSASRMKAGQQIDALQKARQAARAQMDKRGAGETVDAAAAAMRTASAQPASPATAKVKFEAARDQVRKRDAAPVVEGGPAAPKPAAAGPKKEVPKEEGLSRLMQAKKRAREDMDE